MHTTQQLLEQLRAQLGGVSDYRIGKILGIHQTTVNGYRAGRTAFDDEVALQIADRLGLDKGYVLACMQAERADRAKRPAVREAWERIARTLTGTAAALAIMGLVGITTPAPAEAATRADRLTGYTLYALRRRRCPGGLLARLAAIFRGRLGRRRGAPRAPATWPAARRGRLGANGNPWESLGAGKVPELF